MQEVFDGLASGMAFLPKGEKTALRSFWLPSWHSLLFVITHLGLRMGLSGVASYSIWRDGVGSIEFKTVGGTLGAGASSSSSPTPPDGEAEAERGTCSNTLHCVWMVSANERKFRQCAIVDHVPSACAHAHGVEEKHLASPAKVKEYYALQHGEGLYKVHLLATLEMAKNSELLDLTVLASRSILSCRRGRRLQTPP